MVGKVLLRRYRIIEVGRDDPTEVGSVKEWAAGGDRWKESMEVEVAGETGRAVEEDRSRKRTGVEAEGGVERGRRKVVKGEEVAVGFLSHVGTSRAVLHEILHEISWES